MMLFVILVGGLRLVPLGGSPNQNHGLVEYEVDGVWGGVCRTSGNSYAFHNMCRYFGFTYYYTQVTQARLRQ